MELRSRATRRIIIAIATLFATHCGGTPTGPSSGGTPAAPAVTAVNVTGSTSFTAFDQTSQWAATANLSDGTSQDVTNQADWESTNAAVATVSPMGLVKAVGLGRCDIRATYKTVRGGAAVSVSLNLTGTWSGDVSDSSGPGWLTWRLTHDANRISGTVTLSDTQNGVTGDGTVSASVTDARLTFSMAIPRGALPPPFQSCSINSSGTGTANADGSITGTFDGMNSCFGRFTNGRLLLRRQ